MAKKGLLIIPILIFIFIAFSAGFYLGLYQAPPAPIEGLANQELGQPEKVDFSIFWNAWHVLEDTFYDPSKIDYQQMIYGAIAGMVDSVDDPYTVYMPPEDAKVFKEDVSGEFQGVGMEIGIRDGVLTVVAPLEGTPAQRAGLRSGDKILKVDDTYTADLSTDDVVKLIRGPKGTPVTLTVYREDWGQNKEIEIIRDVIEVPSLKWEMKEDNVAYMRLYQFSSTAWTAFRRAGVEILNSSADSIILDLRDNPGGYLEVAQDIAGWFLERGDVVTIEDFGSKQENKEYLAEGVGQLLSYPLVILINEGSASGSEILAGALRDNRNVQLIGMQSFGKGSVQNLRELEEGSLKVTVAKWLTPNGTAIDGEGLAPDIEVDLTQEDYDAGKDPQLAKAIEIIKEIR